MLSIRHGESKDLESILEIVNTSFACPRERMPWMYYSIFLSETHFYVAETDEKIVGFIFASRKRNFRGEVKNYTEENKIEPLHIVQVAVAPLARRKGVGKSLISHLETVKYEVEGEDVLNMKYAISLYVRSSNIPALQLYTQLGFVDKDHIPKYYPPLIADGEDEDANFMVKFISN